MRHIRQHYYVQVRSASGQCCQSDVLIGASCTQNLISTALRTHKCIKCCPLGHTFARGTLRDYKSCFAVKETVNGSGTEKHFLPPYGRTSVLSVALWATTLLMGPLGTIKVVLQPKNPSMAMAPKNIFCRLTVAQVYQRDPLGCTFAREA